MTSHTGQSDVILANSKFTARVFKTHFPSIGATPGVVYPGINLAAYEPAAIDVADADVAQVTSYVQSYFLLQHPGTNNDSLQRIEIDLPFCR